ncbi:MAG: phosphotransferase [Acidimicrobiales bacterium]
MHVADPPGSARLLFVPNGQDHLDQELAALAWLAPHDLSPQPIPSLPAPADSAVEWDAPYGHADVTVWFEVPPGCPGDWPEIRVQPGAVVEAMGGALARLHALAPSDGSSTPELAVLGPAELVAQAADRVRRGLVDPANFERARAALAPGRLVDQAAALVPLLAKRAQQRPVPMVVTHGAARPEAFWLDQGELRALVGVAGLAWADPYRDLAAVSRWLVSEVSGEALPAFFEAYGLPHPDPVRLEFHVLLDELR